MIAIPIGLPFDELPAAGLVPSPLCLFERGTCPRPGRAEVGAPEVLEGCVNRSIRCVTCGRTGVESLNTEPRRPGRFLKIDRWGEG